MLIVRSLRRGKSFPFAGEHDNLKEVMIDRDLASLGDAFINFAYSLALSNRKGKPAGAKVKGTLLAEALRRAGLRGEFPSRASSHDLADAAEALIVYCWLHGYLTLEEIVSVLEKTETPVDGLTKLLGRIRLGVTFP
jgi:hypothetical protein